MLNRTPSPSHTRDDTRAIRLRFIASLRGDSPYGWRVRDLVTGDVVSSDLTRASAVGVAHYMNVHADADRS